MYYEDNRVKDLKVAYIGGGSRGWAWGFMMDLAADAQMEGTVALYDIDHEAAEHNEIIGNKISAHPDAVSHWKYTVADTLQQALTGADFVVISILPGTFDEMESDVHVPEAYGIYQSVGDTVGAGGFCAPCAPSPCMSPSLKRSALQSQCLGHQLHQPDDPLRAYPVPCVPQDQGVRLLPRGVRHPDAADPHSR